MTDAIQNLIDQLNAYSGDNIWQDVILQTDYDETATGQVDPSCASDRFVIADQIIRHDPQTDQWYNAGDYETATS